MQNALAMPPPPDIKPQQAPNGMGSAAAVRNPAPSHEQTVAALRHFHIIGKALFALLRSPNIGKSDIKKEMIDSVTELVADNVMPAQQAVTLLCQLPDDPFKQKQWLTILFLRNKRAQMAVLEHHGRANPAPFSNFAQESMQHTDTSDDHLDMMSSLRNHYGVGNG